MKESLRTVVADPKTHRTMLEGKIKEVIRTQRKKKNVNCFPFWDQGAEKQGSAP